MDSVDSIKKFRDEYKIHSKFAIYYIHKKMLQVKN